MTQPEFIFLGAAALAGTHVVAGYVRPLMGGPRSLWLSAAGGVPVAFVFLQLLPSLVSEQRSAHGLGPGLSSLHDPLFLVALLGVVTFFGVERLVQTSRQRREPSGSSGPSPAAYWMRVGSNATMDGTIGYLLGQSGLQGWQFWLFVVAMGLTFVVDDYGLHRERCDDYKRIARWVLTAAVLVGAAAGLPSGVPAGAIALMRAFLAGGIKLNVLKEEIPAARPRSFWPFALGTVVYGCLLLVV